ncbi:hypothetical protein SAMN05444157_1841 [Frankineae bacterium MT45]|nr:hypothetical protein SAMN05444157_1841 [Frankineae bacterium MT45]
MAALQPSLGLTRALTLESSQTAEPTPHPKPALRSTAEQGPIAPPASIATPRATTSPRPSTTPQPTPTPRPIASPRPIARQRAFATQLPPVTQRVVLRPVTAAGRPAYGYTVRGALGMPVSCSRGGALSSDAAVDPNILQCFPTAANAEACWAAVAPATLLCLLHPWSHSLTLVKADSNAGKTMPPAHPRPIGLLLTDGENCQLRDGGAWSAPAAEPSWTGYYWCSGGHYIFAPDNQPGSDGLNHSAPLWRAEVGTWTGKLRSIGVRTAYYVGTAS